MNLPDLRFNLPEKAKELVGSVVNNAQMKFGDRMNLSQLAGTHHQAAGTVIITLSSLKPPLAITSETLIKETIENIWRLTKTFAYYVKCLERATNEFAQYYYYEVIFSQPTATCPIPQVTASVFFRVEDIIIEHSDIKPVPSMVFRVEGHHTSHDIRYVKLMPEWISEVMVLKMKYFRRFENLNVF